MTIKKRIKCPQCGKPNTWREDNLYRPFCSERCRLIDLGEWAEEKYRLPSEEGGLSDDDENN